MALDKKLLDRGEARFEIYCTPCHDAQGTGKGIVAGKGLVPPPNFHQDRLRAFPVGQIFSVISDGARTMPSYAAQIPTEDRWAIAAYVKALQLSQSAPAEAGQNGTK
jgi:mono/diheme cytochrome c family protein